MHWTNLSTSNEAKYQVSWRSTKVNTSYENRLEFVMLCHFSLPYTLTIFQLLSLEGWRDRASYQGSSSNFFLLPNIAVDLCCRTVRGHWTIPTAASKPKEAQCTSLFGLVPALTTCTAAPTCCRTTWQALIRNQLTCEHLFHRRAHVDVGKALVPRGVEEPHDSAALEGQPHAHPRAGHPVHLAVLLQATVEWFLMGKRHTMREGLV